MNFIVSTMKIQYINVVCIQKYLVDREKVYFAF